MSSESVPTTVNQPGVEEMSDIVIESFYSPLRSLIAELQMLEQSQLGWLTRMDVENSKFLQSEERLKEAVALFQQVPAYIAKAQAMKKDMVALSNQTKQLVAASKQIKIKKQQEIQERLEKDRLLLAQPASSLVSSSSTLATSSPAPSSESPSKAKTATIGSALTTPL